MPGAEAFDEEHAAVAIDFARKMSRIGKYNLDTAEGRDSAAYMGAVVAITTLGRVPITENVFSSTKELVSRILPREGE